MFQIQILCFPHVRTSYVFQLMPGYAIAGLTAAPELHVLDPEERSHVKCSVTIRDTIRDTKTGSRRTCSIL